MLGVVEGATDLDNGFNVVIYFHFTGEYRSVHIDCTVIGLHHVRTFLTQRLKWTENSKILPKGCDAVYDSGNSSYLFCEHKTETPISGVVLKG